MKKQQAGFINLFGEFEESPRKLVIAQKGKIKLNKTQKDFNLLVKKVEKLQKQLAELELNMNKCLQYFLETLHPITEEKHRVRRQFIISLADALNSQKKMLSLTDKKILKKIIDEQLYQYSIREGGLDEELKKVFKQIYRRDYDKMLQDEEALVEEDRILFEEDLDFEHRQEESFHEKSRNRSREKSRSRKEEEAQFKQFEEIKNKNINSIYRQLAKALHPDLVQDEEQKKEREVLMQDVVNAFENKDLHSLLLLEMTWIQKEENNPEKLSEDKLAAYNQALKDQADQLQMEVNQFPYQPRYQVLRPLIPEGRPLEETDCFKFRFIYENEIKSMRDTFVRLNKGNTLAVLQDIIDEFNNPRKWIMNIMGIDP